MATCLWFLLRQFSTGDYFIEVWNPVLPCGNPSPTLLSYDFSHNFILPQRDLPLLLLTLTHLEKPPYFHEKTSFI